MPLAAGQCYRHVQVPGIAVQQNVALQGGAVPLLPQYGALWEICDERCARCLQLARALALQGQDNACAILPPLHLRMLTGWSRCTCAMLSDVASR